MTPVSESIAVSRVNVAESVLSGKPAGRTAIRTLKRDFTYGELNAAARRFAATLANAGGVKGDRVILLSDNSFEWTAAYLGMLLSGLVCVPLPARIAAADLVYILGNTEARFAFVQDSVLGRHKPEIERASISVFTDADLVEGEPGSTSRGGRVAQTADPAPTTASDLAALMFTSGSTGRPRGVMVTHGNIVANTASIIAAVGIGRDDSMMTVLPFHYCFGTSLLHTYLTAGAKLVVDTRFAYPEAVLEHMQQAECTSFAGVPSHYQILLRNSSLAKKSFPHLHSLLQAGGHLAPQFVRQLRSALPQARIYLMYGQTEATARLACLEPGELASRPGSIGKAIPGVTLRVLAENGSEAQPEEVGEIVAEGGNITRGYWRSPEETAKSFRGGRLYTGDLAYKDRDGFLFIVDRAKEFIKCRGVRTSCRQIEDQLLECEEVLEAAVVGVPDDVLGEAVRAFVVPVPGAAPGIEERVRSFCRANYPPSFLPRDIIVVRVLPKNSAGKVLRRALKAYAA